MGYIVTKKGPDGNNRYQVRFKDEHGNWRSKSAGRYKRDAEKMLRRCEDDVANGTFGHDDITFSEFAQRWLDEVASVKVKPSTLSRYTSDVRVHLIPRFGSMRIKKIKPEAIQSFVKDMLDSGRKPRTAINAVKTLGQIMKTAVSWGYITSNPVSKVERPRVNEKEMDFLSAGEVKRLLAASPTEHRALFATACLSGLREGELFGLKWSDVDPDQRVIFVRRTYHPSYGFTEPKTERGKRAVQITPELANILESHRKVCYYHEADDLVFPNIDGKPTDYHNLVNRVFHGVLDEAGLKRIRFHDLRHSYAALMISLGCNIKWLQRQMGHASLSTTMDTYGHILPDVEEAIGGRLDALIFDEKVSVLQVSGFQNVPYM